MVKNRLVALILRILFCGLAISGLIFGANFGTPLGRWFFYTRQSNLLVAALFLYLSIRTAVAIKKSGKKGSSCFIPRLQMGITLMILFTLVIFWAVLAPFATKHGYDRLWTYGNLSTHFFTPIVAIVDYILFNEPGKLKKRDIGFAMLFPLASITTAFILGFSGFVFYIDDSGTNYNFPYFFMNYKIMGFLTIVIMLGLSAIYFTFALLVYRFDVRRARRLKAKL